MSNPRLANLNLNHPSSRTDIEIHEVVALYAKQLQLKIQRIALESKGEQETPEQFVARHQAKLEFETLELQFEAQHDTSPEG